jgi:acetyl-CoA acetyltransferase
MISKARNFIFAAVARIACFCAGILLMSAANVMQAQKLQNAFNETRAPQQPLYAEYKGVRIGMTADEVRSKLGQPSLKGDDQDYFAFSEQETAQVAYDSAHKVTTVSVDYMGGVGAPDPRTVVGGDLEVKNGAQYKLVRYPNLGFWVSYNRTAGPTIIVTITIQKMQKI